MNAQADREACIGLVALLARFPPKPDDHSLPPRTTPAAGFSVKQLSDVCQSLADAAEHLPHLAHITFACELDALLSSSQAAGLSPLAGLKQLTSLAFVGYQVGNTATLVALAVMFACVQTLPIQIPTGMQIARHPHTVARAMSAITCTHQHRVACLVTCVLPACLPACLSAVHAP